MLTPPTYLGGYFTADAAAVLARAVAPEPDRLAISGFRYALLGIHDAPLVTTFGVLVILSLLSICCVIAIQSAARVGAVAAEREMGR